jgi:hypothetical protein
MNNKPLTAVTFFWNSHDNLGSNQAVGHIGIINPTSLTESRLTIPVEESRQAAEVGEKSVAQVTESRVAVAEPLREAEE